jgi:Haemolysin XhlA.
VENRVEKLENEVSDLKTRMAVAENNIKDIRDDIKSIMGDTKWLRRAITNALIVATISGTIGIFFALIKGVVLK